MELTERMKTLERLCNVIIWVKLVNNEKCNYSGSFI